MNNRDVDLLRDCKITLTADARCEIADHIEKSGNTITTLVSNLNEAEGLLEEAKDWVASPPWARMELSKKLESNYGEEDNAPEVTE